MEELGGECTSHPLLLTVYRLTGVPNTGGSAIVYTPRRFLHPKMLELPIQKGWHFLTVFMIVHRMRHLMSLRLRKNFIGEHFLV